MAWATRAEQLTIRIGSGSANILSQLLEQIDKDVCNGVDNQNTIMNGGQGFGIQSVDPEPHTTFTLHFGDSFYNSIGTKRRL